MGFTIEDGKGSGKSAGVTNDNQLQTTGVIQSVAHYVNHKKGQYYTLTINQQATAADDCIGYIKNNSEKDLVIESFYLFSTSATLLTINIRDTGTPNAPTTITPVNCNAASGNLADVTAYQGADLDDGGASLSGGSTVLYWAAPASDGKLLDFHPTLIIPKNQTITFWTNQNAAATIIGLGMMFSEVEE